MRLALKIDIAFRLRDGYPRAILRLWISCDGAKWTEEPETEIDYGLAERSDEELIVLAQEVLSADLARVGKLGWAAVEGLRHALREELSFRLA